MKVLLVGGGGREHALAWALARSPGPIQLLCAPGNVGTAALGRNVAVKADDVAGLTALADAEDVGLVVVGPEAPLIAGLADALRARGRAVFGCDRDAAVIEGSKAFAKAFMARQRIPSAAYGTFADATAAARFVDEMAGRGATRLVVKADGLAAGKGVVICDGAAATKAAAAAMLAGATVGEAGRTVVIEEFLVGREASLMALVDGERVTPLVPAEDHKSIFDGDVGPMTGGMGAVSPTPVMDGAEVARAVAEVLEPAARGLVAEGRRFRGLLYAGLMLTADGPRVLEFNCRFGDPETQAVLVRLDEDLASLLLAAARGEPIARVRFHAGAAACVVMAAPGYPGPIESGAPIGGLDEANALDGVVVFHAGTARASDGSVVTAGGRVLGVTASGADLDGARARAYAAVQKISFAGAQWRRDIGMRGRQ